MRFEVLPIAGCFRLTLDKLADERGYFARTWCARELAAHGLVGGLAQASLSHNLRRGTLRGMHYQAAPLGEHKLVRCSRGRIHDVLLDLRPESASYLRWYAEELTADDGNALYLPPGIAHGFQTLEDNSDVFYQMAEPFEASAARGVRWDDPAFAIAWPAADARIISARDLGYPAFDPGAGPP